MKYTLELIEAVGVVAAALGALPGGAVEIPADLVAAALDRPQGAKPADLMALWNSLADDRLPRCKAMTAQRRRHTSARLKEFGRKQDWEGFINAINHNPWALGEIRNDAYPNWKGVDFDWMVRPGSILKYLEGRFGCAPALPQTSRDSYRDGLDKR